ncbi:MAG: TetR family transcriptional regulator [Porticoccaceae bacterium]|nr:TetR family transcriptional regulator [Porticoccaceae bacterium]
MNDSPSLRDSLIDKTIAAVVETGLESVSLRAVVNAVGCSTTAIFGYFGNKSGLLQASLKQALEEDRQFLDDFAHHTRGLTLDHQSFSALLASYIELRAKTRAASFWSEVVFKSRQFPEPEANEIIRNWYEMHLVFWQSKLEQSTCNEDLGSVLVAYSVTEQAYSLALHTNLEYLLLLRESCSAITAKSFGAHRDSVSSQVWIWLESGSPRFSIEPTQARNPLCQRLLDQAAKHIILQGVDKANIAKIAKDAGTSSAMVLYHFGTMAAFTNEAIWKAIVLKVPEEMIPVIKNGHSQKPPDSWVDVVRGLVNRPVGSKSTYKNFYLKVARIIGQTSLLCQHNPELKPLIDQLRINEGVSIHHIYKNFAKDGGEIGRSTSGIFGLWLKGQVIIDDIFSHSCEQTEAKIMAAVSKLTF